MNKDKFMKLYNGTPAQQSASDCYDTILKALGTMYTDMIMVGIMSTIRTEVGRGFKPIEEYSTGVQYEGRKDLGNLNVGDGVKYKGRGFIQLTGRSNYAIYGQKLGIDLIKKPELALQPDVAARIMVYYFRDNGCFNACNAKNWVLVRRLVNGGTNGLDVFLSIVQQYISL